MIEPAITIFVPTYRRPQLLKKAIESAINQTQKDIQVVVCDNASQDETSQIVAKYMDADPRIHYICHPKDLGMLGNYQFIFDQVRTDFFSILSDDDILLPNFCDMALKGFSEFQDIIFFSGSIMMAGKEQGVLGAPLDRWSREGRFMPPDGLIEMIGKYPVPMGVLFRKEAASQAVIDFENPIVWDCDFLAQLAAKFPFAISKKYCGIFRLHSQSYTGSAGYDPLLEGFNKFKHRILNYSFIGDSVKLAVESILREDIYQMKISSIKLFIKEKQSKEAINVLKDLIKDYRLTKTLIFLLIVAKICVYFPFTHFFLSLIRKVKRSSRGNPWQGFEQYQKLLDQ